MKKRQNVLAVGLIQLYNWRESNVAPSDKKRKVLRENLSRIEAAVKGLNSSLPKAKQLRLRRESELQTNWYLYSGVSSVSHRYDLAIIFPPEPKQAATKILTRLKRVKIQQFRVVRQIDLLCL